MEPRRSDNKPGKVTLPMLRVLDLLLSEPTRGDWFALQVCRETRLGSGTVVQILFRLDRWGWVESRWESFDEARESHRPRRKFYRMTATGAREATALLATNFPGFMRLRLA